MSAAVRRAVLSPYALLSFAILCWSGNFVVGRWANLDAPPVALSFWRHAAAAAIVLPFVVPVLRRDWPAVRGRPVTFAVLCALFVAGNTLVYFSILHTTVINAALINAGVPVAAALFSWMILRDLINRRQALGIVACFAGIALVVTRADAALLLSLEPRWGDLFMLGAVVCWALYMVLLKRAAAPVSPWTLLVVLSAGGALWLVPAYAVEIGLGDSIAWTGLAFGSLAYVALFSTVAAWACWNSGTLGIGPNRASAFMCLHPVFGPMFGMAFFGEQLFAYHGAGTVLVLAGVFMVSRPYREAAPPPARDPGRAG